MMQPPDHVVEHAMQVARMSPRRSKRGVVIWDASTGAFRGHGFNAPPALLPCPGREVCAGTCGQRAVHAEVRALYAAALSRVPNLETSPVISELLHVELASMLMLQPAGPVKELRIDHYHVSWGQATHVVVPGALVACNGPSCGSCAALIADVGFIAGVWLFEASSAGWAGWRRYTSDEFYAATMARVCVPQSGSLIGIGRTVHKGGD